MYNILMFEGIVAIDKPAGMTSHDVIYRVRRLTGVQRVGHAGTLDPFATGVLIVAVGRMFTKQLGQLMAQDKVYFAELQLGATSTTDDPEGEIQVTDSVQPVEQEKIEQILPQFIGEIMQTPPIYSAIKVRGQPAHRRVRKGQTVELAARPVHIHSLEIVEYQWPILRLRVHCGKGVYIRSLARDIGAALETGAYLTHLDRERVGEYTKDQAIAYDRLDGFFEKSLDQ